MQSREERLGQSNPEAVARLVARPINALAVATKPFVRLLTTSTTALSTSGAWCLQWSRNSSLALAGPVISTSPVEVTAL